MILADGMLGQMMEPVEMEISDEQKPLPKSRGPFQATT